MSYEEGTTIHRSTIKLLNQLDEYLKQRDQYKAERDTLIDDIAVLRANNSRLERENESLGYAKKIHLGYIRYFSNNNELLRDEVKSLKQENKALRLQADTYFDEWQNVKNLYNALTQHIRQKAEANPNVDRYIALVNYIDRLERD